MPAKAQLGELEAAVMNRLWAAGSADAKAAHRAIGEARRITLNTVQSTLERLYRKGLLAREKVSHAYVYRPRQTREEYALATVRAVVGELLGPRTEPLLSAFVDLAAQGGDEDLDRLQRLVAERRASHPRKAR